MRSAPGAARGDHGRLSVLALGALGIVFGDIGTSPLYAFPAAFSVEPASPADVLGILSLFFWTLVIVVTFKYVLFVMRADNHGEGGVMALLALARRRATGRQRRSVLVLGLLGVALFYGDGAITPAISVLSAVEGTNVAAPGVHRFVVPATLLVLAVLFAVQRYGSGRIGSAFGPIMAVWFVTIAALGIHGITRDPAVFHALDPLEAVKYIGHHPWIAFVSLGAVVLCITGVEALYADMGHFGRVPIATAWLVLVLPSLLLCYFGQGALVLRDPRAASNPFFHMAPHALIIPLVVLATVATVIASQAVIAGAFSLTQQAIQLGYLPRMTIRHTSEEIPGQVYVPAINWLLCVAVALLVLGFRSSSGLAGAYGVAVTGTMTVTTVLASIVTRRVWGWSPVRAGLIVVPLLAIDLAFFGSNLLKVRHGGWFPLLVAGVLFVVMLTWDHGRAIVTRKRTAEEGPLRDFIARLNHQIPPVLRAHGTAVYLNARTDTTPLALRYNVRYNQVRHEHVVIFRAVLLDVPHVREQDRVRVDDLGDPSDDVTLVTGRFGYRERPDVPAALAIARERSPELRKLGDPTYFLSRIILLPVPGKDMALWRKRLFAALARNAASPSVYFGLPHNAVISIDGVFEI